MICVFGNKQEPCSPNKRRRSVRHAERQSPEDAQLVSSVFDTLNDSLPLRHRAEVEEHLLGACSGIAYIKCPTQTFARRGETAAFFKGPAGASDELAAKALLREYEREPWDADAEVEEPNGLRKLSLVKTPYAFILHDDARGLVFAARDPRGAEQMFWGSDADGDLLFCSDRSACRAGTLLEKSCADADLFPAGALFISDCDATSGRILDIIPIEPEEEEEGEDESQLCRPASCSDFGGMGSRAASQGQIAAQ